MKELFFGFEELRKFGTIEFRHDVCMLIHVYTGKQVCK